MGLEKDVTIIWLNPDRPVCVNKMVQLMVGEDPFMVCADLQHMGHALILEDFFTSRGIPFIWRKRKKMMDIPQPTGKGYNCMGMGLICVPRGMKQYILCGDSMDYGLRPHPDFTKHLALQRPDGREVIYQP